MNFGERLKLLREDKDLKQEDIAKIMNVDRSTVGKWESSPSKPDYEKLIKLADYFNVSVDYLLGRTNIKEKSDQISNALEGDKELSEFWNELREREDLQLLFKQTKNLSPKGINQVIRIIKAIEDEEDRENE